ncbi:Gfo/Idh/MocA family oxidoreductase [Microbacterium sp. CFBP9034]|uniref:Gfo/Idh/MocA family protein n=1 Tax=Microbacterium sp. CFBP9034 TaxID=3096540 RepID=UPI002A69B980|nr:Gfo/Idh/MocA family oxidoreductase [Microbacterium sp. CFBP9034]MDY0910609.1 Gfo/Idh/MocA family oxidoreductase [Microbacterium sp. CFBP9034]
MSGPLRVGIAGVHGHGRSHVDAALALGDAVELVAVADPRGGGDVPPGVRVFTDAGTMLDAGDLDIAIFSTPIPTHADLAVQALEAGAHVLLEKPPVVSIAEHARVDAAARAADRSVQVGFQSLASAGVAAARQMATSGEIGELEHVGAVGLWSRSEEYWRRSAWAGRRHAADGAVVADGAVTNPLAHAVATALAIAGARTPDDVRGIRTDLRRANDIDTDDTSSLVIDLAAGGRIAAALSVTAPRRHEPYVLLRGSRGHALYFYTLDLLQVHRAGAALPQTFAFTRVGLLADLVAHARHGTPLAVPLADTGAFTRVLEEVVASPAPRAAASAHVSIENRDGETFRIVRGIEEWSERVAWEAATFSELGAPW